MLRCTNEGPKASILGAGSSSSPSRSAAAAAAGGGGDEGGADNNNAAADANRYELRWQTQSDKVSVDDMTKMVLVDTTTGAIVGEGGGPPAAAADDDHDVAGSAPHDHHRVADETLDHSASTSNSTHTYNPLIDQMSYRTRLMRMLLQYDPEKMDSLDAMLLEHKGREDQLFRQMNFFYGPDPNPEKPLIFVDTRVRSPQRNKIQTVKPFYNKSENETSTNNRSVPADAVAATDEQRKEKKKKNNKKKKGEEGAVDMSHKARLERLFQKYEPKRIEKIDKMLAAMPGKEEAVIASMVKKYGPEPEVVVEENDVAADLKGGSSGSGGSSGGDEQQQEGENDNNNNIDVNADDQTYSSYLDNLVADNGLYDHQAENGSLLVGSGSIARGFRTTADDAEVDEREMTAAILADYHFHKRQVPFVVSSAEYDGKLTTFAAIANHHGYEADALIEQNSHLRMMVGPHFQWKLDENTVVLLPRQEHVQAKLGKRKTRSKRTLLKKKRDAAAAAGDENADAAEGEDGDGDADGDGLLDDADWEAAADTQQSYRYRMEVLALLESRAPQELPKVDKMLLEYKGQEEVLIEQIKDQYPEEIEREVYAWEDDDDIVRNTLGDPEAEAEAAAAAAAKMAEEEAASAAAAAAAKAEEEAAAAAAIKKAEDAAAAAAKKAEESAAAAAAATKKAEEEAAATAAAVAKKAEEEAAAATKKAEEEEEEAAAATKKAEEEEEAATGAQSQPAEEKEEKQSDTEPEQKKTGEEDESKTEEKADEEKAEQEKTEEKVEQNEETKVEEKKGEQEEEEAKGEEQAPAEPEAKEAEEAKEEAEDTPAPAAEAETKAAEAKAEVAEGETTTTTTTAEVDMSPEARLMRLFKHYDKPKANAKVITALLAKSPGTEEKLIAALVKKYGPEPDPSASAAATATDNGDGDGGDVDMSPKARLTRLLEKYDPPKAPAAGKLLEKVGPGKEEALIQSLVKKYGPEPTA